MINMTLSELATLLQAKALLSENSFHGVSIDTRTLTPGNLFVAIRGAQFDGHDFISAAINKGAAAVLASQPVASAIPHILVDDTVKALGILSKQWRNRFAIPLIGLTGSNGKTTTKNMIDSILRAACHQQTDQVLASIGNFNNELGLPLTLLRLNAQHRYGVIEMGMNHFGEIAYLTELTQPQVALITNAAESHIEHVQNVAGVAKAKGELFLGLKKGGTAILNRDDAYYSYWLDLAKDHPLLTFGLNNAADVTAVIHDDSILLQTPKGNIRVTLSLLGTHNIMNALAATAATLALDIDLMAIKQGLENVHPAPGRMRQYFLTEEIRVIDDTYNANPFSLDAAVQTLKTFSGTKIVVLGDMKELGPEESHIHFAAGQKIREAGIDYLFTFGNLSAKTTEGFGNNALHFTERADLLTALKPYLKTKVTILVKGSRSMKMEKFVAEMIPQYSLDTSH